MTTNFTGNGNLETNDWLFEVVTPLGLRIHTTQEYWEFITKVKHRVMEDRLDQVIQVLENPDEIRQSRSDERVLLFYRSSSEFPWMCAVLKDEHGSGYLITAYPTDKTKRGIIIWKK